MTFSELQKQVHKTALDNGWWDKPRSFGELIALCHSELSEALEADRNDAGDEHVAEELADTIIRIMDMAEKEGWDIERAIIEKDEYNRTRAYRHGKRY